MSRWYLIDYDGWQYVTLRDLLHSPDSVYAYRCLNYLVAFSNKERSLDVYNPAKLMVTGIGEYSRLAIERCSIEAANNTQLSDLSDAVVEEGGAPLRDIVDAISTSKWKWLAKARITVDASGMIVACRDPKHYFTPERWVRASLADTLSWMGGEGLLPRTFTTSEVEQASRALCAKGVS